MRATLPMLLSFGLAAPLALALPSAGDPVVAIQAGTIHLVQEGRVIEGPLHDRTVRVNPPNLRPQPVLPHDSYDLLVVHDDMPVRFKLHPN